MGCKLMIPPVASVGMHISEVDTPALLIDLDALEANIARLQSAIPGKTVRLRPHSKTHKSTTIAHMQISAGAVGVCCQKVAEAEIMVDGGITDICVSNEVIGKQKITRLAALARRAKLSVCVDDANNVADLADAAAVFNSHLDVLVELNVGMNRCGVETAQEVVDLARVIARHSRLRFAGIQAYHGSAQHLRQYEERQAAIGKAVEKVGEAKALLARSGFSCDVVAGAGTGTFEFELASGLYNEIQAGSYVLMDVDYGLNKGLDGQPSIQFENSLFVLASVMSRAAPDRAIVDAGLKSFSVDSGLPKLVGHVNAEYTRASDEHGQISITGPTNIKLGDKVMLIPGHCDPTVNLYDWFICVRKNRVEGLWPVSARGASA
jgi:3-hydroxy-D-aspartate aldolase